MTTDLRLFGHLFGVGKEEADMLSRLAGPCPALHQPTAPFMGGAAEAFQALNRRGRESLAKIEVLTATTVKLPKDKRRGKLDTWQTIHEFIYAGNARFTLLSLKTGQRYTYKVQVKKADLVLHPEDPVYFVNLLRGPDNTADYAYMGVTRRNGQFNRTSASKVSDLAQSYKSWVWFLERMRSERADVLGALVEFWHEGRCCCCGRVLTVPSSVLSGYGEVCRKARNTGA
jgi:hypothetical protein